MIFRKKSNDGIESIENDAVLEDSPVVDDGQDEGDSRNSRGVTTGPWDATEIEDHESRIDLGSLLVAGVPGLSLQVQVDENTQRITMVTLILADAAVQVQAFAAPRSSGIWDDVRKQLTTSITNGGGLVESAEGLFGTELRARVPAPDKSLQPARFVGVDGPRWFLRGLFLGSAAAPAGHPGLTEVFSNIAVVRGDEAMASGEPLPLQLPPKDDPSGQTPADEKSPPDEVSPEQA